MKKIFTISILILSVNLVNAQWSQMGSGISTYNICSFTSLGNCIFAGTASGLYRTTNNGGNWTISGFNNKQVSALAVSGNILLAGYTDGNNPAGVFISTNNGSNWTQTSLNNLDIEALTVSGSDIYAGTSNGVYHSSNMGANWTCIGLADLYVHALTLSGSYIYAGVDLWGSSSHKSGGGGVYVSSNNGASWAFTGLYGASVYALTALGGNIYAGIDGIENNPHTGGVYKYNGSWSQMGFSDNWVHTLTSYSNCVVAGITYADEADGGIYISTDGGTNWIDKSQGFLSEPWSMYALLVANNYIFSGTGHSVWRRQLSEVIGIRQINSTVPKYYSLQQNYPNPFNPFTKIRFSIAPPLRTNGAYLPLSGGDATAGAVGVRLTIFDILGREVTALVDEQLNPGSYEVEWNASDYPSGVYFYRITAGSFSDTKKLIVIK